MYIDITNYSDLRSEIRKANICWMRKECEEIARLQALHDDYNLHKKLKEAAGVARRKHLSILINNLGQIVTDMSEKVTMWET